MLSQIPPLPNGMLPKLIYYPSVTYDDRPRVASGGSPQSDLVIMAESDEIVLFAWWDGVSPKISRFETHLKYKPEPDETVEEHI